MAYTNSQFKYPSFYLNDSKNGVKIQFFSPLIFTIQKITKYQGHDSIFFTALVGPKSSACPAGDEYILPQFEDITSTDKTVELLALRYFFDLFGGLHRLRCSGWVEIFSSDTGFNVCLKAY